MNQPISSGDRVRETLSYDKKNAFDKDPASIWASSHNGTQLNQIYIGYEFNTDVEVRGFSLRQWTYGFSDDYIIENSQDGIVWDFVSNGMLNHTFGTEQGLFLKSSLTEESFNPEGGNEEAAKFWRIRPSNIASYISQSPGTFTPESFHWNVSEIIFYGDQNEVIETPIEEETPVGPPPTNPPEESGPKISVKLDNISLIYEK